VLQPILTDVAAGGVVGVAVAEAEGDGEADSDADGAAEAEGEGELGGVALRVAFGLVTFDVGVHAESPMTSTPPTAIVSAACRSRPAAER
jgi:hypothetical protein